MATRTNDPIGKLKANAQGYFEIHWSEKGRGKRFSCRTKDAAEAKRKLSEFRAEMRDAQARAQAGRAVTVDELCEHWLEQAELKGQGQTGRNVLRPIRRYFGDHTHDQITVERQRDYRRARGSIKASTLRREIGALKTVMLLAHNDQLIDTVPKFEPIPITQPKHEPMTKAEAIYFWDQAIAWGHRPTLSPRPRDAQRRVMLIVCLGMATGARRGAIHQLTWDRVDFDRREIDYRVPGQRVTKKRRVVSAITDRLLPVLEEAADWAPKDPRGNPTGPVLGTTSDVRSVFEAFRTFTAAIGMSRVTPHLMRHSLATLMSQRGTPVQEIAAILGDTPKTVMENYLHHTPERLRQAVNSYLD